MRVLFPPLAAKHAGSHRDFPEWLGRIKRDPHSKASRTSCKLPRLGLLLFKRKIPLFPPLSYLVAHNTRKGEEAKERIFFLRSRSLFSESPTRSSLSLGLYSHKPLCFCTTNTSKAVPGAGQNIVDERPDNRHGAFTQGASQKIH